MTMSRVGTTLAVALLGAAVAGTASAATQGTLGSTSQGDLTIRLTINSLVQISNLDDIDLGTYTGAGPMSGADDVCVYSNNGGFDITATGDGTANAFTLVEPGGTTMPYTVQWANTSGATSGTAMTTNTTLGAQTAVFSGNDCGGGTNATVLVDVAQADLDVAPAAAYSGVLTLLVAPQ